MSDFNKYVSERMKEWFLKVNILEGAAEKDAIAWRAM
jgi:hypothetical protein